MAVASMTTCKIGLMSHENPQYQLYQAILFYLHPPLVQPTLQLLLNQLTLVLTTLCLIGAYKHETISSTRGLTCSTISAMSSSCAILFTSSHCPLLFTAADTFFRQDLVALTNPKQGGKTALSLSDRVFLLLSLLMSSPSSTSSRSSQPASLSPPDSWIWW